VCCDSGYRGRSAVYEVMCVSDAVRKMIGGSATDEAIKHQAIEEGMRTLRMSAIEQVRNGVTTLDEIQRLIDMSSD